MKKLNQILTAALVLQLILIFFVYSSERSGSMQKISEQIIQFDPQEITALELQDSQDQTKLVKQDQSWQVAKNAFPAQEEKVKELLDQLAKLKAREVAGKSLIAARQLLTHQDAFEKQVTLYVGKDNYQKLYFGKVPSFKMIYVRNADSDNTFVVSLEDHQLSAGVSSWYQKDLLKFDAKDLMKVKHAGFAIMQKKKNATEGSEGKEGDTAELEYTANLKANETLQKDLVEEFVKRISTLTYSELPRKDLPKNYKTKPKKTFLIDLKDKSLVYKLFEVKREKDDDKNYSMYLKSNAYEYYFEIPYFQTKELLAFARGKYVITEVE